MKHQWLKRGLAVVMAFAMTATIAPVPKQKLLAKEAEEQTEEKTESDYNYAKAFQLSMYFYDANMCGHQDGRLKYRYDCHMEDENVPLIPKNDKEVGTNLSQDFIDEHRDVLDPDGDGCLDLSGGFHDAGDHVKFGLPQSYSGATLGWGYYEFRDSYVKVGEQKHIEDILRHFNDYFLRSTFRDEDGKVVAFCYQVGDGAADHCYWGCPEFQTTPRPVWLATSETPASDQCAGAAASLAINYFNFKDTDPEYAETCLDTAKALYEFAKENRGCGFSGGFYNSSYDEDEMSWAAVWLNIATGDKDYITDITAVDETGKYTGYMSRIIETTDSTWQNIWVHSWDTVWGGVFAKLAPVTDDPLMWYFFRWNIEYWSGVPHEEANDQTFMKPTPGGFRVVAGWGSARYNAAAQLCAQVYNKYKQKQEFVDWCKSQMDYILGDNPKNTCFEVGYAENSTKNPHHRASHGSTTNSMTDPVVAHHVLWGALAGGPGEKDDYNDDRTDYVYNEVAVDYNAGFVGALAALYAEYGQGQEPLAEIPQEEDERPFYNEARLEQENKERTQVTVRIHNDSACPPRRVSGLSVRYYFNISELLEANQTINDISTATMYDEALTLDGVAATISKPVAWDEDKGIYYIEITWPGAFHGKREIQFAVVTGQDSNYKTHWDPTNDYSREDIIEDEFVATPNIPIYYDGKLALGEEPGEAKVKPAVKVSVAGTSEGDEISFVDGIKPITLNADVTNGNKVTKVEFYVNGEKAGADAEAPYSIQYLPEQTNEEETKELEVTAKAITSDDITVTSKPYTVTARFLEKIHPVIEITSPQNGTVIDTTKGEKSVDIEIAHIKSEVNYNVDKVIIYADGKKIGEGDHVTYTAPEGYSPNGSGLTRVKITAEAVFDNGRVVGCDPVMITVKQPIDPSKEVNLTLETEGKGLDMDSTIQRKYIIRNNGSKPVDLSKVKIRYYFTNESTVDQSFFCDAAGMNINEAPYYYDASNKVKADFATISGNDRYMELSFDELEYELQPGQMISCDVRFFNSSWSMMDQTNDYSFAGGDTIVMMYDQDVIQGIEPGR